MAWRTPVWAGLQCAGGLGRSGTITARDVLFELGGGDFRLGVGLPPGQSL